MRCARLLITALLAASSLPAGAQNRLDVTEITSGWILLFDGASAYGWAPRGTAQWAVQNGELVPSGDAGMLATTSEFADFELQAEVWIDKSANSGLFFRAPLAGEITQETAYEANIFDSHRLWPTGSINGVSRARSLVPSVGKWTRFHIVANGPNLTVSVDGKQVVETRNSRYRRGVIALQYNGAGEVRFRNVKLKPLGLTDIFNGKNLEGWKVLPGQKSIFSVTPEGWLNVKDGSGDLQSESAWGDFVLQLDIISNGTHLNSGIFFRSVPGQKWLGYESQIRNEWQDGDREKPRDYGTGGLYNRLPARRVISNDREWFTKTIVATGYHIAIWINGYLVSDFEDTRPKDETNARNGARKAPGSFTIQGHDPTTDLSFRNIRAVEYPAAR